MINDQSGKSDARGMTLLELARVECGMPLARYFVYVGSVLLALLFVSDACLPKLPVIETSEPRLPVIRIYSEQRGPQRLVFDTRMIIPPPNGNMVASAVGDVPVSSWSALAQMRPSDPHTVRSIDPKTPGQPLSRKVAKHRSAQGTRVGTWQPQYDWFGSRRIW